MKKCICILTSLTFIILTACSSGTNETVSTKDIFSEPFTCTANIVTDDLNAIGKLSRYGLESWEIEFSEPTTLSGVMLTFDGVNSEASYKGLSFSMPKSAVPVNSMLLCLATAIDEISTTDEKDCSSSEGLLTFKGSTDCGDYILTVKEDSGDIAMFEMKNLNLVITFSDVSTLETSSSEETSAVEDTSTTDTETVSETFDT
ncbi:MAG: hypothetical protein LIO71_08015 [Ruminococcus sp.]|nr:hypothetical protein [Ruminococcus sp.]